MYRIREVRAEDLDSLWDLVCTANVGMTSLQIDKETLSDRVERSVFAFRRVSKKREGAPYVFVLDRGGNSEIVGTSCIFSRTGGYEPFYSYKIETERRYNDLLKSESVIHSLHLAKVHDGPTEIGGLFLAPEMRGKGCGKLLSLCRFVYMALHPHLFAETTIAEMRGYQDERGESPFWNAIGAHFFRVAFPQADSLSMIDKSFIEELMPRYPIYLELLPKEALEVLGRVHEQTRPALSMLETQGFRRNNEIDIFDAGPIVVCETSRIHGVSATVRLPFQVAEGVEFSFTAIVARCSAPFMAVQTKVLLPASHSNGDEDVNLGVLIDSEVFRTLELDSESEVSVTPL